MATGAGGGGGRGDDIRGGGAYFEVQGRDKLSPVLKSIEGKVAAFGKTVSGVRSAAMGGIAGGFVATAMRNAVSATVEWALGTEKLTEAFERAGRELQDLLALHDKFTARREAFRGFMDTEGAAASIDKDIKRLRNELDDIGAKVRGVVGRREEIEGDRFKFGGVASLFGVNPVRDAMLTGLKQQEADLRAGGARLRESIESLQLQKELSAIRALQSTLVPLAATGVRGSFSAFSPNSQFGFGTSNSVPQKLDALGNKIDALLQFLPGRTADAFKDAIRPR